MKHPIMTLDVARRIEQAEIDYSLSRLKGMQEAEGNPLNITVESFRGATALFLDLYQRSFQYKLMTTLEKEVVKGWLIKEKSRLNLYMAYVAGEPAGVGVLYMNDGVGLLADAATLPEFRGRVCQTALLHHRIDQAARKNCDLVTSFVEFGGGSHRNIERAGLKTAYTKSLWTSVEETE